MPTVRQTIVRVTKAGIEKEILSFDIRQDLIKRLKLDMHDSVEYEVANPSEDMGKVFVAFTCNGKEIVLPRRCVEIISRPVEIFVPNASS